MPKPARYLLIALLCCPLGVYAQLTISGIVRDSATFVPLPYVSIQVAGKAVTFSNKDGFFSFNCHIGDTSVFTHMSYKKKTIIHFHVEKNLNVNLADLPQLLKAVTIIGDFKPQGKAKWRDYIILPNLLENPAAKDEYGMIQTVGVGGRIYGPISYFTKYERDRRKYKKVMEDMAATQIYREVISSEQVKSDLIQLFAISEEQYLKKIELFNIKHPDAAYLKTKQEIIDMLIAFFALKEN